MRILIAEDSVLLADALRAIDPDTVDLVLTDVRMPPGHGDDGLRAALDLRAGRAGVPVLVLSQYVAAAYARRLLDSGGGVGYLLKERVGRVGDFLRALDTVASGGVVVDPEVISKMFTPTVLDRLTPREGEVLALMAEGRSNADIAAALVVSDAAVAKHVANIFAKLDLPPEEGNRRVRAILTYLTER
ncbi:LuxR C-terminal-related transcriptional regulator [Tsukamurella ocularis]|uniref:LuxR C-terminal-related transcriptional regulator n=1 Tax=Tsukamurella ocularis TaxID=1970234 RepID=UPI002169F7ED|nr:response regulator transcription factor [Tsukamurella ocularis]MCS3778375.1 DNA-binding NarL/FixJ family response regulator [Tsukamurella ocularis]MCS3789076.1 DNA-binding NarL/FixJ family response regulator [Tsukamurella ocularis]MCS3852927.1 DNA-binding NarL/FixJ family response regulator [Tsukamurella ocularis]